MKKMYINVHTSTHTHKYGMEDNHIERTINRFGPEVVQWAGCLLCTWLNQIQSLSSYIVPIPRETPEYQASNNQRTPFGVDLKLKHELF